MLRVLGASALLASSAIVSSGAELGADYSFEEYVADYERAYSRDSGEYRVREKIVQQRLREAREHNAKAKSWKMGVNHLTDLTDEELKLRNGYKPSLSSRSSAAAMEGSLLEVDGVGGTCMSHKAECTGEQASCCSGLVCGTAGHCEEAKRLAEFDWTPQMSTAYDVLEQGPCGSCWAMAAAATLQFHAEIVSEKRFNKVLSPQSILACTPNKLECGGQGGCKGATGELAFEWIKTMGDHGGVLPVDQDAYTAQDSACASKKTSFLQTRHMAGVSIQAWKKIEDNKASVMMETLVTVGPLLASIAADGLHAYHSGVIDASGCNNVLDHAVVMMGYGDDKEAGMPYWKIRNSWGNHWGERGYCRIQRFEPNTKEPCGWDNEPDKGVVCKDKEGPEGKYPEKQWVCGACGILADTAYPIGTRVPPELMGAIIAIGPAAAGISASGGSVVEDVTWCQTQCQHFQFAELSQRFDGVDFGKQPGACAEKCVEAFAAAGGPH